MAEYKELLKILSDIGNNTKLEYKQKLKDKNKVASGKLYDSIDFRIEKTDSGAKLYFVADKYYLNIENGRRAGSKMPPVEVIKRWMSIKGIKPRSGQTINGTAILISRSIAKKGIKANPFLQNIKTELKDYIPEIKKAFELDLKSDVKKIEDKLLNVKSSKYITIKKK